MGDKGVAEVTAVRRCPQCGRRTSIGAGCPEHGAPPERDHQASPAGDDSMEMPAFPGLRTSGVLGRGGFGVVYAVERLADGARLAVKLARADVPGAAGRLRHEIEALRAIGPPWVPAVHGEGTSADGAPYVILERIDAPTLAALLGAAGGSLPADTALTLAFAVLAALAGVHARGRVHGDLKPENILIGTDRTATLLDLGLTVPEKADATAKAGLAAGTPEYMAPEQCDGRPDIDARADVYAMGVLLHELLTGRPPFWGPPAAVREAHRSRRPTPPSALVAIQPGVEEVVLRCLAKRPEDRYADARALTAALRVAIDRGEETPPPSGALRKRPTVPPPPPSLAGRRRVGLIYLQATVSPFALRRRLLQLGGELVHISGRRSVALYSHEVGENPARRALRAAQALVQEGLCERARVDLAAVHVQTRRDGSRRYLSAAFDRAERYPGPAQPAGVLLGPAAAAVLSEGAEHDAAALPGAPSEISATDTSIQPLFGRRPLLDALLLGARRAMEAGEPAAVAVLGEVGSGKSRVFRMLRAQLALLHPGARVLAIEARELGEAGGALGEILRVALDLPERAPPDGGRELLRERLGGSRASAARWAPVALALGWIPVDAPELAAFGAAPGALRSAPIRAAGEALRALAEGGGCFVLIDDAHLCDEAALAALDHAAGAEGGARLWTCAFGRPAFAEAHPAWGASARRRERYELGPLDPESAAALCRWLLLPARDVPELAVRRLVERAQASPLLLHELVRGLQREGAVRRDGRGGVTLATEAIEHLPDMPVLEWLAEAEMDALPPALQTHARLCALLGDDVGVAEIGAVIRELERQGGADDIPLDALAGTERLVAAGLLARTREGQRVHFRHPLLREAIARGSPAALRERVHLAAVEHYRHADGGARRDRLAAHAAAAGLGAEAAAAYLAIGELAEARHDYLEAEIAYGRALAHAAAPLPEALRGRGLMRYRLGRHADALEDLAAARAQAAAAGDTAARMELLLDEATVLDWMGEFRSAEERVRAAEALPPPEAPLLRARLLLGAGRSLHRADREGEAAAMLERAAAAAVALGDQGYETLVIALLMLGFVLPALGRLQRGARVLDDAIRRCEERGDLLHLGPAINNRAHIRGYLGDREGMVADLERAIAIGRELGQPALLFAGHINLAEFLYLMDDLDAAEPHLGPAALAAESVAGGSRPALIGLLAGRMRLYRGDEAAAAAIAAEVRGREAEARAQGAADATLSPSEDVLCAMIELAATGAEDAAWDALEARAATFSVGQERIEVVEARGLSALRRGRRGDAACHLERALELSARIPNMMRGRLQRWLAEARAPG